MSDGIQVRGSHHIGKGIVVGAYCEGFVPEVLLKLVSYGPLESQELQLGGMVLSLTSFQLLASIGDQVEFAVVLFLRQYGSETKGGGIGLKKESFLKSAKASTSAIIHFIFKISKASFASSGRSTGWVFHLLASPSFAIQA